MADITIYTKSWCPYCAAAKSLLTEKGAAFTEIDVEKQPDELAVMLTRSNGRKTVPQIFINSTHVGGNDDLQALEREGKLDALLKG